MTSHDRHPDPALQAARAASHVLAVVLAIVLAAVTGCREHSPAPASAEPVTVHSTDPHLVEGAARPRGPMAADQACINAGCHASFASSRFTHGVLRNPDGCKVCHEDDQGDHVFPVRRPGNQGCTFCHDDIVGQRLHVHAATEVACVSCHDPHTSTHGSLLRAPSAALCGTCHPPSNWAIAHPPYADGACVACHEPHESDVASLLRGGGGASHCYLCHEETRLTMTTAKRVHAPAQQNCLSCHAAHGTDHPHLLKEEIDALCFSCHTDLETMVAGATAPHGAMTMLDGCANCHDAHASDQPSLLKERQDVLCLRCHDKPIVADDGRKIPDMTAAIHDREFLHGPVKSGNCTACHNVHGASHARLLRENFTPSFYTTFDLKSYALCFDCHESALVTEPRTTTLTDFRDGDVNLHFLHVNRDKKGRTCRACHEMHGSDLPAHVAESVPFEGSGWALPIGFRPTENGGSCGPGCHKPMSYERTGQPILRDESPAGTGGKP